MSARNILVSGASGIVGYGILRTLRLSGKELQLIGSSIYQHSAAQCFCDVFEPAPMTADGGYMTWLAKTIRDHDVDLVIPGIEADVHKWIDHVPEIERSGAVALLNRNELVRLCGDKWDFFGRLRDESLPYVIDSSLDRDFGDLKHRFGLPFVLKPRRGFGARGIVVVGDESEFERHRQEIGPVLMAQARIGNDDEEYTVSIFGDGQGGFCAGMALRRRLSKEGFTESAEVVELERFVTALRALCKSLCPLGPTNFQFRDSAGSLKLLEINPRISSATSIRAAFGYNEAAMAVDYFLDGVVPSQPEIRQGKAVRYVDEHISFAS